MVIQNYDSLFLDFTNEKREAYFPVERFSKNRVVDYLFINPNFNGLDGFMSFDDVPSALTPNGTDLMSIDTYEIQERNTEYSAFLDVSDNDKLKVFDSMPISQFLCRYETGIIPVKTTIDPSLSRVRFYPYAWSNPYFGMNAQLNVGIIYCNTQKNPTSSIFRKRSFPLQFDESTTKIKIKDFTKYGLRDKEVKKICVRGLYGEDDVLGTCVPTDKWITLKTFNDRDIYQLSSGFVCDMVSAGYGEYDKYYPRQLDDIYFDDLRIDEDNSFIENPSLTGFKGEITFYY